MSKEDLNVRKQEKNNQETTDRFSKMVEGLIEPFIQAAAEKYDASIPMKTHRENLVDLFSAALLKGMEINDRTNEEMDNNNKEILSQVLTPKSELELNMEKHQKETDAATALNLEGGHPVNNPRFVTGDMLDENGQLKRTK